MSQIPRATCRRPRNPDAVTRIAQLARALPLQGRCRGFESLCAHGFLLTCEVDSSEPLRVQALTFPWSLGCCVGFDSSGCVAGGCFGLRE